MKKSMLYVKNVLFSGPKLTNLDEFYKFITHIYPHPSELRYTPKTYATTQWSTQHPNELHQTQMNYVTPQEFFYAAPCFLTRHTVERLLTRHSQKVWKCNLVYNLIACIRKG